MIVFPAIDLLDGKVVRLRQGRLDAVTVYNDSPVDQAKRFAEAGAEWIHVVDLDGAVTGRPVNLPEIAAIADAVPEVGIEAGGGIRNMESLERLIAAGARRIVLGTTLVTQPDFVAEACEVFPGIVAGIDARDGKVAVEGWRQGTEVGVLELVKELLGLGVRHLAYTDIAQDGMQTGVNADAYRALAEHVDIGITASGGVASLDDVRRLAAVRPPLEGVIVGRALYEHAFNLPQALAVAKES
jgi:phosphoribosylformimino-5-aminoimidazole carboxamide ribotide isomerase